MGLYEVPGITLIPQQLKNSCWYASTQMLIQWRMDKTHQSLPWLVPPELDAECQNIRDGNAGIFNPQILPMARRIGLKEVPPQTPTVATLENWLRIYGPLWVNGKSHIVVIGGINTTKMEAKVYDPAPVGVGRIEWRSLRDWYLAGASPSTRDTGKDVDAVFLYVPTVKG